MSTTTEASPKFKSLVLVPTFNESENILTVIARLLALQAPIHILIVDDGSPDGTGKLVECHPEYGKLLFLLSRPYKSGYAGACKEGFQWCLEHGYEACVTMDADLSHDPSDVPALLAEIEKGADLAVGSRYKGGIRIINWPLRRLLLSSCAGLYIRTFCRLPMSDPTSGFKAVSQRALKGIDLSRCAAQGYGFIVEFHYFIWQNELKIEEVPIIFTERRDGASKMSTKIIMESAITVMRIAILRLFYSPSKPSPRHN